MMKHKAMSMICCAVILCALTGCQLAQENTGTDEDRLVGMFVTTEYLDLFDYDGYLTDNLTGFSDGDIVMDGDMEKYQGRLYAKRTPSSDETSKSSEIGEYVFEGIAGVNFFAVTVPATNEKESIVTSVSDPAISDGNMSVNYGDDADSIILEGTIYIYPTSAQREYYMNPVYQSEDGSVYLIPSRGGYAIGFWTDSEGGQYAETMEATYSATENGKIKTKSISVELSYNVMFTPEKIVILQMNEGGKLLSSMEYIPGEMPESFSPEAGAAYLIVETHKRDAAGDIIIARDIYGIDSESFETYFPREDGICQKYWTQIIWK